MSSNKAKKTQFINEVGPYCWFCRKKFKEEDLTIHHAIPKYLNSHLCKTHFIVACKKCHTRIHQFQFGTPEYMFFTLEAMDFYKEMSKNDNDTNVGTTRKNK